MNNSNIKIPKAADTLVIGCTPITHQEHFFGGRRMPVDKILSWQGIIEKISEINPEDKAKIPRIRRKKDDPYTMEYIFGEHSFDSAEKAREHQERFKYPLETGLEETIFLAQGGVTGNPSELASDPPHLIGDMWGLDSLPEGHKVSKVIIELLNDYRTGQSFSHPTEGLKKFLSNIATKILKPEGKLYWEITSEEAITQTQSHIEKVLKETGFRSVNFNNYISYSTNFQSKKTFITKIFHNPSKLKNFKAIPGRECDVVVIEATL